VVVSALDPVGDGEEGGDRRHRIREPGELLKEEGTVSSFLGLIETIAAKGLSCSL
jgi:hypothetical protein